MFLGWTFSANRMNSNEYTMRATDESKLTSEPARTFVASNSKPHTQSTKQAASSGRAHDQLQVAKPAPNNLQEFVNVRTKTTPKGPPKVG